jgi:hypothetical protein
MTSLLLTDQVNDALFLSFFDFSVVMSKEKENPADCDVRDVVRFLNAQNAWGFFFSSSPHSGPVSN